MRTTRLLALSLGVATALLASGCRIPPSGVIQAGEPAGGLRAFVTLYWVGRGPGGHEALHPVSRPADEVTGVAAAVSTLVAGPTGSERQSGLATRLPFPMAAPRVTVTGSAVTIRLQPGFPRLTGTATGQLACTATAAWQSGGQGGDGTDVQVTVTAPPAADTGTGTGAGTEAGPAARAKSSGWQVRQGGADCPSSPTPSRADPAATPPDGGVGGGEVGGGVAGGAGVVPPTAAPSG